MDNTKNINRHLANYLLDAIATPFNVAAGGVDSSGIVPSFAAKGIPLPQQLDGGNGIFPALIAASGGIASGGLEGEGLLSLLALA
jgi:hypothetical protein